MQVRVTNLPEETTDADLRDLFSTVGRVQRIYLAKDKQTMRSKGCAFVTYDRRDDAEKVRPPSPDQKPYQANCGTLLLNFQMFHGLINRKLYFERIVTQTLSQSAGCKPDMQKYFYFWIAYNPIYLFLVIANTKYQ